MVTTRMEGEHGPEKATFSSNQTNNSKTLQKILPKTQPETGKEIKYDIRKLRKEHGVLKYWIKQNQRKKSRNGKT